jgi:hypothetical protein
MEAHLEEKMYKKNRVCKLIVASTAAAKAKRNRFRIANTIYLPLF